MNVSQEDDLKKALQAMQSSDMDKLAGQMEEMLDMIEKNMSSIDPSQLPEGINKEDLRRELEDARSNMDQVRAQFDSGEIQRQMKEAEKALDSVDFDEMRNSIDDAWRKAEAEIDAIEDPEEREAARKMMESFRK